MKQNATIKDLLSPDDTRDGLRKIGGLLFGLGCLMIFIRKGPYNPNGWADFPTFLLVLIPAVLLYGSLFTVPQTGELRVWQVVHSVFGLIFVLLALIEFVDMIGGSPGSDLNTFWIFGVTAAAAFYAGALVGVRVQILLGSIAVIISWSALWDKILSDGISSHFGTYRGLLGILAIILLAGAVYLWRTNLGGDDKASSATSPGGDLALWKASELITGAGIAAVVACSLGISSVANLNPFVSSPVSPIATSWFWDLMLLAVSLGLVGIGSQIGTRGPVYIGSLGLFFFLLIAGLDLDSTPPHPDHFGGWPWVLLILGIGGLALGSVKQASQGEKPRKLVESARGR